MDNVVHRHNLPRPPPVLPRLPLLSPLVGRPRPRARLPLPHSRQRTHHFPAAPRVRAKPGVQTAHAHTLHDGGRGEQDGASIDQDEFCNHVVEVGAGVAEMVDLVSGGDNVVGGLD